MEDDKTTDTTVDKVDKTIEDVTKELKKPDLTVEHLEALEQRLESRIHMIATDKNRDAEDKAELQARIDKLNERIEHLIEAQEERDRKHNDESTIVVPPKELDPPTHQNLTEVQPENPPHQPQRNRRLKWW